MFFFQCKNERNTMNAFWERLWKCALLSQYLNRSLSRTTPLCSLHIWMNTFTLRHSRSSFCAYPTLCVHIQKDLLRADVSQFRWNATRQGGRDREQDQFPVVIKHLNINNPEAWSCTAHMSAPASLCMLFNMHTLQASYSKWHIHVWYFSSSLYFGLEI